MRHGIGERVVVIDADLEYSPEDIPAMIARLDHADAVIGSRFLNFLIRSQKSHSPRLR